MRHEDALVLARRSSRSAIDVSGTWRNELGSKMTIRVSGSEIHGTYESTVSGTGGPITGELSGYVDGALLSFVVKWPRPAITAWVGHVVTESGQPAIETLWQMTTSTATPGDPTELWDSVLAGADRFTQV